MGIYGYMANDMHMSVESLKEELDEWLEKYANNPIFVNYLLLVGDIMDLLPLSFEQKQALLYILLLEGEVVKIERLNRSLNRTFNKDKVEEI